MKTQYPNSQSKEQYIKVMTLNYENHYPEFSTKQIKFPLKRIVNSIDGEINKLNSDDGKMIPITIFKRILKEKEKTNCSDFSQREMLVVCYLSKSYEIIEHDLRKIGEIDFPEDKKDKYLKFISEMTEKVTRDICQATEQKIPHTAKVKFDKLMEGVRSQNNFDDDNNKPSPVIKKPVIDKKRKHLGEESDLKKKTTQSLFS